MTKIRGDQLASALGAYDRWMSFSKIVDGKPAAGQCGGGAGEVAARRPGRRGGGPVAQPSG